MIKIILFFVFFINFVDCYEFIEQPLSNQSQPEIKTIRLINCPPDDVIRPCRCSKFNINYLKSEIMNSMYHNMDDYNNVNTYLICSFNDDSVNLTDVFNNIYNFYIKSSEQYVIEPKQDQERVIINHNIEEQGMNSLHPKDKHELQNYKLKKIELQIYGFISNSIPFSNYEMDFGKVKFEYIDISYTGVRKLTFKKQPNSTVLDSVHTLILAYNQFENDHDENIDLPIKMTRLAIELNKFSNLKVLILKGNRLNHFNIPRRYLTYKQLIGRSSSPADRYYVPYSSYNPYNHTYDQHSYNHTYGQPYHSYNYKNYKDYHRIVNHNQLENRRYVENKIEVFPKLLLLDVSENNIQIIPPNAYKLLPKLMHLNLMSNSISRVYGRSFVFTNNQTDLEAINDNEAIITELDRVFDQNIDDYLKNKSITTRPKPPNEYYNYGTFSFENKTLQQQQNATMASTPNSNNNDNQRGGDDDVVNIYLGGNELDCAKINQFAFVKIEKKFTLHLDFNNFDHLCEDLFENLLHNEQLQWVNLHKNAISCLHCGNRWIFTSKMRLESRANIEQYERIREERVNRFREHLFGRNYSTSQVQLQPIVTGQLDPKAIKYDVFKLANVKCVNPLSYDLSAQVNKPAEIIHLQDFNLNSFSHCNLKKKQLINSLKHFALFLKAFNVITKPDVERINEILE